MHSLFPSVHTFASVASECVPDSSWPFVVLVGVLGRKSCAFANRAIEHMTCHTCVCYCSPWTCDGLNIESNAWHLAQASQVTRSWKKQQALHLPCCLELSEGRSPELDQGLSPDIAATELQSEYKYVEYKRVILALPIHPAPVLVILVFPSWFPRLILLSISIAIAYHTLAWLWWAA